MGVSRALPYQGNEVPRMLSPELSTAAEDDEGDEEKRVGHIVGPDVCHHEALHAIDEGEHSHGGQRHAQLYGQHQEHLRV